MIKENQDFGSDRLKKCTFTN